ncbi:tubulin binding cofactor C-domain-containing protein [Cokeromyces recurvatus]|uniref:tubulin binding cofactor C-domain-containing protein n=1 Tax=Cokeromyces recurvatus TaxID=90255 RepID=UPI00221EAB21|nr:tubulin binding cofactor C-domain-containing protein [Cokeromyces recurvatus]KAI7897569.1 tubulin binding cofactor C-domain-containing protein [Cokeromyces recurvatus]
MTEKSATEASNDFWLEFKSERQVIEDQISQSRTLLKPELANHFNTILQNINNLEKKLTRATDFIPSYDERQFSIAKLKVETKEDTLLSDATVLFKDKENSILSLDDDVNQTKSIEVLLSNLKNCIIILGKKDVQISAIHVKNVDHCVIYGGLIQGSVLIYGLNYSTLFVGCHQLRIHEAHHVDMMLHVTSRPIIEDSDSIQVGCWNANESINYFDQIEDFNWLKKQASPNWKVMDKERQTVLLKECILKNSSNQSISIKKLSLLPA